MPDHVLRAVAVPARTVVFGFLIVGSLGVAAPGGLVTAGAVAGAFVVLSSGRSRMAPLWLASVIIAGLLSVLASPHMPLDARAIASLAGGALFGFGLCWFALGHAGSKRLSILLAAVMIALFIIRGYDFTQEVAIAFSTEPAAEGYCFDPVFFIKTFYLVDGGQDFFDAFRISFQQDMRFDQVTPDLAGWRTPTVTWLWSAFFSSGSQLAWGYLALAATALAAGYLLASRITDHVSALVVPALMTPYYMIAIPRAWFPTYEYWATFAALGAAVLLVMKQEWPALGVATLAGAMREWLLSATLAGMVQHLHSGRWKRAVPWAAGAAAVIAAYILNAMAVRQYLESVGVQPDLGEAGRMGGGGIGFILYTARYGSEVFLLPVTAGYIALALGLLGAAYLMMRGQMYLPALLILPLCAFMIFGSGRVPGDEPGWNDYYNAAYMPFAYILAAASWKLLTPRTAVGDSDQPRSKSAKRGSL